LGIYLSDPARHPVTMSDDADQTLDRNSESATAPRYTRRLSDKILLAIHTACDRGNWVRLLQVLEGMLTRRSANPGDRRRQNLDGLVMAHERLWVLRHPDADQ
jgi:hypothetical protein